MRGMHALLKTLISDYKQLEVRGIIRSTTPQKKKSSKSQLKMTKKSPNKQFSSTKPIKSKAPSQFRNKSNI